MSKLGAMKRTLLLFVALIFAILLRPQPSFGQNYVTTGDYRKVAGELIRGLMDSGKSGSTAELMTEAALKLLGTPYGSGTLDEDPSSEKLRIYLTRTDCILFVETCLNLALTVKASEDGAYPTFEDFAANVARSRYRVDPPYSYSDRVHYTTEWIRRQEGILRDVTLDLGGEEYDHPIHFMSRHPGSYKQLSANSANPRAAMDLERIKGVENDLNKIPMTYIPKNKIASAAGKIKTGDIICFVSAVDGLDIAHVGIAIVTDGKAGFVHASQKEGKVVIDSKTIEEYVKPRSNLSGIKVVRPL